MKQKKKPRPLSFWKSSHFVSFKVWLSLNVTLRCSRLIGMGLHSGKRDWHLQKPPPLRTQDHRKGLSAPHAAGRIKSHVVQTSLSKVFKKMILDTVLGLFSESDRRMSKMIKTSYHIQPGEQCLCLQSCWRFPGHLGLCDPLVAGEGAESCVIFWRTLAASIGKCTCGAWPAILGWQF